jgi:predicted PurR-regulated permease PerM
MISLANSFPQYIEKVGGGIDYWIEKYALQEQAREILLEFSRRLEGYASGLLATLFSLFGGLISTLAIIVISFYLTLNASDVKRFLVSMIPTKNQPYISGLISRLQVKMGQWLRSQLILMVIIGLVIYIGLTILNVRYALILALIAGLLEIVPWLGPWLAGIFAVFLSFFQSPVLALLVVILYVAVQQLENNLIVPQIMKRVVGLNPVVVILALLIGGKIAGILGAVLAVPSAAILAEFIRDYRTHINK